MRIRRRRTTGSEPAALDLRSVRLSVGDSLRNAATSLAVRPTRVLLSALGIALGIAAMVAVVGISSSSRADVDRRLAALGTNMLTVEPGRDLLGDDAVLPDTASSMVARIPPVESSSRIGRVRAARVYRNDLIPSTDSGTVEVVAAEAHLLRTVKGRLGSGRWLTQDGRLPTAVLGAQAAESLGITRPGDLIWLGHQWFGVVGIMRPVPLASDLDDAAIVGWPAAREYLGFDGRTAKVYVRVLDNQVQAVRSVLAATADPAAPYEVSVSRPSDALAARHVTAAAFNGLLLALALVGLVVGGIGVANTMVVAVMERRGEIGLRRALGARRTQVLTQFVLEALMLAGLGGLIGAGLGTLTTAAFAIARDWPVQVPWWAVLGGVALTLPTGVIAGLAPAVRAARTDPSTALTGQ